jgi:hypothetical protein
MEMFLQKKFIELHMDMQKENGVKSRNPREMARSAYGRALKDAENGRMVVVKDRCVWEVKSENTQ